MTGADKTIFYAHVVNELPFGRSAVVRADAPSKSDVFARRPRRKFHRYCNEFGRLIDTAPARPAWSSGKRILTASVNRAVVAAGFKRAARNRNVSKFGEIADFNFQNRAVIKPVSQKCRFQIVSVAKSQPRISRVDAKDGRSQFVESNLIGSGGKNRVRRRFKVIFGRLPNVLRSARRSRPAAADSRSAGRLR